MKLIRVRRGESKMFGFSNGISSYGKNFYGKFRVETKLDLGLFGSEKVCLYQGSKKPIFKSLPIISAISIILTPISILLILLFACVAIYIQGMVNFIKDSAWVESVREFTWINFIIIILGFIWLVYKLFLYLLY